MAVTMHQLLKTLVLILVYLERFISREFYPAENVPRSRDRILFLAVLVAGVHLHRELHLGNWNIHLLLLVLVALQLITKGREVAAGMVLAWVCLMKPHFLVLAPLLLARRKIRSILGLGLGVLGGMALPALFVGVQRNLELHRDWFRAMLDHNSSFAGDPGCVYALVYKAGIRVLVPDPGLPFMVALLGLASVLFALFVAGNLRRERDAAAVVSAGQSGFAFEYLLLLAVLPSITVTDTEHYLWSLPVILFVLRGLEGRGSRGAWLVAGTAFLLYGGNVYDLWGRGISRWIAQAGLLGIGNLALIVLAAVMYRRLPEGRGASTGDEVPAPGRAGLPELSG